MKLPSKVKIGACTYSIKQEKDPRSLFNNEPLMGEHDFMLSSMRLKSDLPHTVKLHVLLHESLHALWKTAELHDGDKEEVVVERLTHGLHQFIQDNPELIKQLLKG